MRKDQDKTPYWQNASVFGINKQDGRCTSSIFPDRKSAKRNDRSLLEAYLDGDWSFHWVPRPADKPKGFYELNYDASSWGMMPVPAQWELNGYGVPIYAPYHMPPSLKKRGMPNIDPEDNPVGSYRHQFTIRPEWQGREIYLQFDGVCSAMNVWLNGEYVGYSQGSMLPAEFYISPFLVDGEHLLAVEVFRFSDGSY